MLTFTIYKRSSVRLTAAIIVSLMSLSAVQASEPQRQSSVPVAVQELRRHMLDADMNALTFRNMDELFDTRTVTRAGPVSAFPREDAAPPDLAYDGKTYSYQEFADATYTNAFLIIRDGEIVFEDYRNNTKQDTRFIAFSMSKSITSLLIGIAIDKGAIKTVDDLAVKYVPELKGSGYDGVTIRQILEMRSGADYEERYDFGENPSLAAQIFEYTLVQNTRRFMEPAKTIGRKTKPGSHFNYSTLDTSVLGRVLENATGRSISKFMSENLWEPAGMEYSGYWLADGPPGVGRETNGMGFNATLRDFGRIGEMALNNGAINGHQIVSKDWMAESTKMLPFDGSEVGVPHGSYGYQWWKIDDVPGAFMAWGLQGQFIYVDPKSKTVVVKLSFFPPGAAEKEVEMTAAYFESLTRWSPKAQR